MDDRTIKDGPGLKWSLSKKSKARESGRTWEIRRPFEEMSTVQIGLIYRFIN